MNHPQSIWSGVQAIGPMLRPSQAAKYLGISVSTLYDMIKRDDLPPLLKITANSRASGIPKSWLDAAITRQAIAAPHIVARG